MSICPPRIGNSPSSRELTPLSHLSSNFHVNAVAIHIETLHGVPRVSVGDALRDLLENQAKVFLATKIREYLHKVRVQLVCRSYLVSADAYVDSSPLLKHFAFDEFICIMTMHNHLGLAKCL